MKLTAGELDRRIGFQVAVEDQDAAGDPVLVWSDAIERGQPLRRWARKVDGRPAEDPALGTALQVLRSVDTVFTVRFDSFTRDVAPESHRVTYRERVYEILGLGEGDREDAIKLLCCSRPDQRGARGREPVSGQP
jgi:head-tail adaptor